MAQVHAHMYTVQHLFSATIILLYAFMISLEDLNWYSD